MRRKRITAICFSLGIAASAAGCGKLDSSYETVPVQTQAQPMASTPAESAPVQTTESAVTTLPEDPTQPEQTVEVPTEPVTEAPTQPVALPTEPVAVGFESVQQIVKTTTNLNLRTGPGTEYDSAGIVPGGTNVTRIGKAINWSQVIYNGQTYYMANQYLELVKDGETLPVGENQQPVNPTQPPATQPSQQQPVTHIDYSQYDLSDLAAFDNTVIPYGFGSKNRDEFNRPTGVFYYGSLYSQYGADFIGPNTNTIYLTMDEGYEAGYTPTILDTLKEKNVKATFFVTKQFVTEHPELVTRMINEGHTIGNHSCKHPSDGMPTLGLEGQVEDIMWLQNYVKDNFGYTMTLFRYPSGIFSVQSLALMNKLGLRPVFWSFAHKDWDTSNQPDVTSSLENIVSSLHPGAIYLLHAVSATNTALMGDFIDKARAAGYEFGQYPATGF
ncbi:MAG: polysaccharide deacetylase family protein [Lachnospiraceae bacterium]|nr:polysaccharide deacetylase family protein [Lachnospiraceae bacterium]